MFFFCSTLPMMIEIYGKIAHLDQKCYETFFLDSTLPMMIEISGKNAHIAQKCCFYQKRPVSKVETFQIELTQNH